MAASSQPLNADCKTVADSKALPLQHQAIVFFPKKVDPSLLYSNGKLFPESSIQQLEKLFQHYPISRYSKKIFNLPYGIIKGPRELYAVYNANGKQVIIGKGGFADVKFAQQLSSGKWYVLKTIQRKNPLDLKEALTILQATGKTDEPQLLPRRSKKKSELIKFNVLLKLEKGKNLLVLLSRLSKNPLPLFLLKIVNSILIAYQNEIANNKLLHRDIKLENILFYFHDMESSFIDFDFAKYYADDKTVHSDKAPGTVGYIAPEILQRSPYSEKSEIHALGIVFQEILLAQNMFRGEMQSHAIYNTPFRSNSELCNFLNAMHAANPDHRPSLEAIMQFFNQFEQQYAAAHPIETEQLAQLIEIEKASERLRLAEFNRKHIKDNAAAQPDVKLIAPNPVSNAMDATLIKQCNLSRKQALMQLGNIDETMPTTENELCPYYAIHRANDHVALVTACLSNPTYQFPNMGYGLEFIVEAKKSEISDLGNSVLFQLINEVTKNLVHYSNLRQMMDSYDGIASMSINNVAAPAQYLDFHSQCVVLLGMLSPTIPPYFLMPGNFLVKLITIKLLTLEESQLIYHYQGIGRNKLVEKFTRDGSYHVSSIGFPVLNADPVPAAPPAAPAAPNPVPAAPLTAAPKATAPLEVKSPQPSTTGMFKKKNVKAVPTHAEQKRSTPSPYAARMPSLKFKLFPHKTQNKPRAETPSSLPPLRPSNRQPYAPAKVVKPTKLGQATTKK